MWRLPVAAAASLDAGGALAPYPGLVSLGMNDSGRIMVDLEVAHGLIADSTLDSRPNLPGPAAAVERVPLLGQPLRAVQAAGFTAITITATHQVGDGLHSAIIRAARP